MAVDEVLRQRIQQTRIGRLQCPGGGRRIVRVKTIGVELVRRIDNAGSEKFRPQEVHAGPRKLKVGGDELRQQRCGT